MNRLQMRRHTYRGEQGVLICGRDSKGRSVKVFCKNFTIAYRIREKIKSGEQLTVTDFEERQAS